MTTHLEETLQRDADQIRRLIRGMADLATRTLRDCAVALNLKDRQLCQVIILRDQRVDHMEKQLDRLCLEFLLRHQPVGGQLRFASAALRINFQLERVGDYAESIARQILKLIDLNCQIPGGLLEEISAASITMLQNAVTAFLREDPDLAGITARVEEHVDILRNQANNELTHMVQSNQMPLAALTPLLTIVRRFERVSDQAKTICQETSYLCTGQYAKHQGSHVYRVLFVDDHHGALSRLGEAIGKALNRPEFQFSSAGLKPQPPPAGLENQLRQKGLPPVNPEARKVPSLPEFHEYQIVVALSLSAQQELPPPTRKTAQFQWMIVDPSRAGGPLLDAEAVWDQASSTLTRQVSELVSAILAEDPTDTAPIKL